MGIKGSGKGAEARGEESIYGSLMAKLWHFQTPSCAATKREGIFSIAKTLSFIGTIKILAEAREIVYVWS